MELNKIWNESNEITMKEHIDEKSIDVILTSPPYNNSRDNDDRTYGICYSKLPTV